MSMPCSSLVSNNDANQTSIVTSIHFTHFEQRVMIVLLMVKVVRRSCNIFHLANRLLSINWRLINQDHNSNDSFGYRCAVPT